MRIVVIGGGIYGVSAALELRIRGHEVVLIEREPIPHSEAASTDISKLVRLDYGDDDAYTEMMEIALRRWERFNAEMANGEEAPPPPLKIYHGDGILALSYVPPTEGTTFFKQSFDLLRQRGHALEMLSRDDIRKRFPMWDSTKFNCGYWNAKGGWVESGKCTGVYARHAASRGVEIVRDAMRSLIVEGGVCKGVTCESGARYLGEAVLVAAGAWTPVLLPHLQDVMWPTGQIVHHFQPPKEDAALWNPPAFPPYLTVGETGFYGFPAHYSSDGRVKIGHHGRGVPLKALATSDLKRGLDANLAESEAAFRKFIAEHFPRLSSAPKIFSRICLYCDSFDGDFWIDRDSAFKGLFVAAGDSGHGFKFATILGDLIADTIEDKPNKFRSKFAARSPSSKAIERRRTTLSAYEDMTTLPIAKL